MNFLFILGAAFSLFLNNICASEQSKVPHPNDEQLKKILSSFESYSEKAMKDWDVPGMAIAVVRDDKIIYSKAFGVKEKGKSDPVDVKTIFQIGSISKSFTSTLVAMMVDKGYLKWDDKVIDHLPDFRMYDPWVTSEFEIEDLLAQRSGLETQSLSSLPFFGFDRTYTMQAVKYVKPVYSFRSKFSYINTTFLWAAALVEKYTKKSWEKNLDTRIFGPLGMTNSSSTMKDYVNAKNSATLHTRKDGDPDGEVVALHKDWPFFDWVYTFGPAGSIASNVLDMSKWIRLHLAKGKFQGKQLVTEDNLNYTHMPHTIASAPIEGEQMYYGLSWVYNTYKPYSIVWHNGGTLGAKSIVSFMPEAGIGIVVLTNLNDDEVPEVLAKKFYDLYFDNPAKDWSKEELDKVAKAKEEFKSKMPKTPLPANTIAQLPSERYVGTYNNKAYGKLEVKVDKNGLFALLGPKKVKLSLKHWNANTFELSISDLAKKGEFVRFNVDPNGKISSVLIKLCKDVDEGIFDLVEDADK
ncbi:MAG: serine hydrolase [bacterium]